MRRAGKWWLTSVFVLGAAGCAVYQPYSDLRPKGPEEYKLPPEGLYTGEPTYPKELLNQYSPRKEKEESEGLPPTQTGRMGAMGGRP
jgi:hypothetical protein